MNYQKVPNNTRGYQSIPESTKKYQKIPERAKNDKKWRGCGWPKYLDNVLSGPDKTPQPVCLKKMLHKNVLTKSLNYCIFCSFAWYNFAHVKPFFILVKISVGLDSSNFSQDMMFLRLNTVPINFWNLNQDFLLHSPWDGSRLCEFGDRERLLFTKQLFANPSDRPTRGPVDLLKPITFCRPIFTNAEIWSAAVCDVWVQCLGRQFFTSLARLVARWWQGDGKVGGKVVARWWQGGGCSFFARVPQLPHTQSGGLEDIHQFWQHQRPNKCEGEVTWNNWKWYDELREFFLIYPNS